jgi:hypothetical protein
MTEEAAIEAAIRWMAKISINQSNGMVIRRRAADGRFVIELDAVGCRFLVNLICADRQRAAEEAARAIEGTEENLLMQIIENSETAPGGREMMKESKK